MYKQILSAYTLLSILSSISFAATPATTLMPPASLAGTAVKKEWTMLVFINGHNNLDEFGALNINQMEDVGSTDHLNLVVQWASMGKKTKRLMIQKDSDLTRVTSPVVEELAPVDMGDKTQLLEFIKWTHANYPADHYMVVVWNHGSGWHFQNRDISNDDLTGHKITTEELGAVMASAAAHIGRKIDIYSSDACLMGMIEIAQEMAGSINTFVGSQELEPGEGWPYHKFLAQWVANPSASSNEVGRMLVESYAEHYDDQDSDMITLSAIDMNELPNLVNALTTLKRKLMTSPNLKAAQEAAKQAHRFYFNDYVDIGDLIEELKKSSFAAEASQELYDVSARLQKAVFANGTSSRAQGLSVWWPTRASEWKTYGARYKGLRFDQSVGWSELFQSLP